MRRNKDEIQKDRLLEAQIKELLSGVIDLKHDKAVIKGMLIINTYQTMDELQYRTTIENNGIGFNSTDGTIATSYCEQLHKRYFLTEKQMKIARKIMKKYWRQLFYVAKHSIKDERIDSFMKEWELRNKSNYYYTMNLG